MSFDAGQFFNNLFNNVGNIGKVNSENETKLKYNSEIANDAKILPDETPDEKVAINRNIAMYAVPNPEPTYTPTMYAVPAPEPTYTPTMYAVPDPEPVPSPEPTGVAPVLKYAMPSPEPMPVPTQPTYIPTPQPTIPHNPVNPWRINIPQIITNLFGNNGSSFAMRVNNAFANFFSRLR